MSDFKLVDALQTLAGGTSIRDVIAERADQIERHGFTRAHDAGHDASDLIAAAKAYTVTALDQELWRDDGLGAQRGALYWPWRDGSFRPSAVTRPNLVKAAALLLAAIDRLDAEPAAAGQEAA